MGQKDSHSLNDLMLSSMQQSSKWLYVSGTIVIIILVVDVGFLTDKVRRLEKQILSSSPISQVEPLHPGDVIDAITVESLDGNKQPLAFNTSHSKYLLFVMSSTCTYCLATIPKWKSITARTKNDCFILGLSLHDVDRTIQYKQDKDLPFYVMSVTDVEFPKKFHLSGVPATFLIGEGGIVQQTWAGKLEDDQVEEIVSLAHRDTF